MLNVPFSVAEISEDCPESSLTDGQDIVNISDGSFIYDDFEPMQYLDEEEAYCQEASFDDSEGDSSCS